MKVEERPRINPAVLWTALAGYVALVAGLGFFHEMWRDEVRALSVAREMSSWGSLLSELPLEGHPVLWYVVLRVGYALTHSHFVLPAAAGIIAVAAAYLILRYAPFPLWLRLLPIFGAFLGYELSVSARNYGLGVLLMLTSCLAFRRRTESPALLGISLFLLANTSIHAAMATLVILLYWLLDFRDSERRADIVSIKSIVGFALAVGGVAFAISTSSPPADVSWSVSLTTLDY
ncbi:MAG TPA: hypothetical protein VFD22_02580, partial [Gemmatimonadaceae bacterium]|nr:hypothetical protein [Gemmatimonadaceae bacterium]